jgi:hypothetical protein
MSKLYTSYNPTLTLKAQHKSRILTAVKVPQHKTISVPVVLNVLVTAYAARRLALLNRHLIPRVYITTVIVSGKVSA